MTGVVRRRISAIVVGCTVCVGGSLVGAGMTSAEARVENKARLVTVLDKANVPMRGLTPSDLVVFEDGAQREVTEVTPATDPMMISVLMDTAKAPMGVVEPTRDVRTALLTFVRAIYAANGNHQVALTEFGGAGVLLRNFTSKQEDMEKSINRLVPSQRSSAVGLEALLDAARDIKKKPGPRRVIVMIDLGSNDTSGVQPSKVAEEVQKSGASVWSVSIQGPQAVTAPGRDTTLEFLTEQTGGIRLTALVASSLEDQLAKLADILTSQYVVTYARPAGPPAQSIVPAAPKAARTLRAPWAQ